MKILVRLPNWLGDMVMSVGMLHQLPRFFPGAHVSVIAKKGLHELLPFFPPLAQAFVFDKTQVKGPRDLWQFGKKIEKELSFDLFLTMPDSFSSALMGFATGARQRVGYKNEGRNILLTHSYAKPKGLHRAQEYVQLLEFFTGKKADAIDVSLRHEVAKENYIVININSEAQSRRLTPAKAVELIAGVRSATELNLLLIGGKSERAHVEGVLAQLPDRRGIESVAGTTTLPQLAQILAAAKVVLTTDSGPAHLANALGTQTIVLFGAGNEANTAPYNRACLQVVRLGQLSCEPCTKNQCVCFETPQCLERLSTPAIVSLLQQKINVV